VNLDSTLVFHNPTVPTQKNLNQAITMGTGTVSANTVWYAREAAIVFDAWVEVGSTLTLGPGTVLKFKSAGDMNVTANGTLNGMATAFFTSLKDDTKGGDSNGDGTASSPAAGDWDGLKIGGNWVSGANITYALNP